MVNVSDQARGLWEDGFSSEGGVEVGGIVRRGTTATVVCLGVLAISMQQQAGSH